MNGWRSFQLLVVLLTIVWALFLSVSMILGLIISATLENPWSEGQFVRVFVGAAVFITWVVVWQKLAEIWLYDIMLRRRRDG